MKFCPNCGKEVNENFNVCPNCGTNLKGNINQTNQNVSNQINQPQKKSSGCLTSLIIVISLFIIIGFVVNNYDSSGKNTSKNYNTKKGYSVSEKLTCPNFDVTIDKVQIKKKGSRIDDYYVIDDPEWIGVTLTVKNTTNETKTFYTSKVDLTNTNGEILDHSWLTYEIWGVPLLNSPELIAGGTKTGYIQFKNNNTDNSNLTLTVDCTDGLFGETVKYKVNISQ